MCHHILHLYSCGEQFKASCEVKVMLSFNSVACFKHEKNSTPQTFNRYSHWEKFDKLSKHLCCYWTLSKILRSVGAHLQIFLKAINTLIESRNLDGSWGNLASRFPLSIIVTIFHAFFKITNWNLFSALLSFFSLYRYFHCLLNCYSVKEQIINVILF